MVRKEPTYDEAQIAEQLRDLPGWYLRGRLDSPRYKTDGWPTTLMLVNAIGYLAEAAYHHPDLSVTWGRSSSSCRRTAPAGSPTRTSRWRAGSKRSRCGARPKAARARPGTPNKFVRSGDPRKCPTAVAAPSPRPVRHRQARRAGAAPRARRNGAAVRVRRRGARDHRRGADDDGLDRAHLERAGGHRPRADPRAVRRRPAGRSPTSFGVRVEKGPKDLREIPEYFGRAAAARDYGAWDIEIVAEINNAPRLTREAMRQAADYFRASGADVHRHRLHARARLSRARRRRARAGRGGHARQRRYVRPRRDPHRRGRRRRARAERQRLEHRRRARLWPGRGARVVVVPDLGGTLETLEPSSSSSTRWGVPLSDRSRSSSRSASASWRRSSATPRCGGAIRTREMLMGIGNLTELTAADSTGVNALLIAVCQELGVRAVLTTEVIPWARGAVREVDVARRLMHYAVTGQAVPKGVDDRLVTIKDPGGPRPSAKRAARAAGRITDPNFRIFADREAITVLNNERFVRGTDIQEIFAQLRVDEATHAFYLGKELAQRQPGGDARQDLSPGRALSWGYLTPPDDVKSEHVRLTQRSRRRAAARAAIPDRHERAPRRGARAPSRSGECCERFRAAVPPLSRQRATRPLGRYSFLTADPALVVRSKGRGEASVLDTRTGASTVLRSTRSPAVRDLLAPHRADPVRDICRRSRAARPAISPTTGARARASAGAALRRPRAARRGARHLRLGARLGPLSDARVADLDRTAGGRQPRKLSAVATVSLSSATD